MYAMNSTLTKPALHDYTLHVDFSFLTVWKIYLWKCPVECRYNAVQYNKIFHTALRWLKHDINKESNHKLYPIPRPNRQAMGRNLWEFERKVTPHITTPHCISCSMSTLLSSVNMIFTVRFKTKSNLPSKFTNEKVVSIKTANIHTENNAQ